MKKVYGGKFFPLEKGERAVLLGEDGERKDVPPPIRKEGEGMFDFPRREIEESEGDVILAA